MEYSSSKFDLPSFSTAVTQTTRPLTYTTVGSVYNPTTSIPLKPPTRRCRTQRYTETYSALPGDDFNSFLQTLVLKNQNPLSTPTTAKSIQQYSPLQQNYDRAVSPELDIESPVSYSFDMDPPSMRSGNLPPPCLVPATPIIDNHSNLAVSCPTVEDTDSVVSDDVLCKFGVRGLTNLASYTNPNQDRAKKVLARGRNAGINRADTPSSFSYTSSDYGKDRGSNMMNILSSGPGAPPPLTAGPPGQRQYRLSALDSTMKAMAGTVPYAQQISQVPEEQGHHAGSVYGTEDASFLDSVPASTGTSTPMRDATSMYGGGRQAGADILSASFPVRHATMDATVQMVETQPIEAIRKYYPDGLPPSLSSESIPVSDDWMDQHLAHHANSSITEKQSRFHEKVNRNFYSGINGLHKSMDQIMIEHNQTNFQKKLGVIGGERMRSKTLNRGMMSVEDANRMSKSHHAEALLNMAYASLLSYKDDSGWRSGFVKAEAHLVDEAASANNSLFDNPKKKPAPKRVLRRATRLGY
jgi:hypothetical protein